MQVDENGTEGVRRGGGGGAGEIARTNFNQDLYQPN